MSTQVLHIDGLKVEFPGLTRTVHALRGVDLSLERGKILGLVGESGSGKSMTALACLGLVPTPGQVRGNVAVDGFQVVGREARELSQLRGGGAAMIFQNPLRALNPYFTIGQQMVEIIRCHRPLGSVEATDAAINGLAAVRLPDPEIALSKYPHQMSGGQIQRVMIALGLACQPKLLIADECTTALDVTVQAQIIVLLRELAKTRDLAVLFITHDLGVVASVCDAVAVMYAGRIVETGPVESVYATPLHPYTRKLMNSVPVLGRGKGVLEAIPGQVPDLAVLPRGCAFADRCDLGDETCTKFDPPMAEFDRKHFAACHYAAEALVKS